MELTELEAAGLNASLYGPPADRVWLYVHGKGGCKEEAADFAALACPRGWQVLAADLPEHGARRGDGVPLILARAARAAGAVNMPKGGGSIPPCGAPVWGPGSPCWPSPGSVWSRRFSSPRWWTWRGSSET